LSLDISQPSSFVIIIATAALADTASDFPKGRSPCFENRLELVLNYFTRPSAAFRHIAVNSIDHG